MHALERLFKDSKLVVHVLVCVFAISSWVDINGMWVELPIFVTHLPEKWTLPSYISFLGQIANIGPIIYIILAYVIARTTTVSKLTLDKVASYAIMLVGVTATFLLAFLWQRTSYVAGSERSVALLALSFSLALMGCTSSVAYVAFMSVLKPVYLSSFFIGEGLSGLLPGLMALGQGAGDIVCVNGSSTEEKNVSGVIVNTTSYFEYPTYIPPRFSVQIFFFLLCSMIVLSILAFTILNFSAYSKSEFVSKYQTDAQTEGPTSTNTSKESLENSGISNPVCHIHDENRGGPISNAVSHDYGISNPGFYEDDGSRGISNLACHGNNKNCNEKFTDISEGKISPLNASRSKSYGSNDAAHCSNSSSEGVKKTEGKREIETDEESRQEESMCSVKNVFLLVQVMVITFLCNTFLLSIQTYSSLPYGISIYNLVVTLSNIANPIACVFSMFFSITSPLGITSLTMLGGACGVYIMVAASESPFPPLVDQAAGGPVAVAVWVGASFFLTYAKVSVGGVMRQVGRRALIWYGVATQFGSLMGGVLGFVLVNEVKAFKDASWC